LRLADARLNRFLLRLGALCEYKAQPLLNQAGQRSSFRRRLAFGLAEQRGGQADCRSFIHMSRHIEGASICQRDCVPYRGVTRCPTARIFLIPRVEPDASVLVAPRTVAGSFCRSAHGTKFPPSRYDHTAPGAASAALYVAGAAPAAAIARGRAAHGR